jgi:hypothetical protein
VEKKILNLDKLLKKREMILERKNPLNMTNMPKNITVNDSIESNFCTSNKSKCNGCLSYCNYSIDDLKKLKKELIVLELSKHNHQKNRTILKKQRNRQQALNEIIQHYKTVHFFTD